MPRRTHQDRVRALDALEAAIPAEPEFIPHEDRVMFETTDGTEEIMENVATPLEGDVVYERQAALGLLRPGVMVVGCGGVGVWVALALALGGVDQLSLWDGDSLSLNNLNRFPLPPGMVGEMKSLALANWLRTLRPKAEGIVARGEFNPEIHSGSPESQMNWLVCATDSLKSRRMCHEFATITRGMNYLEVGADGERWSLSPAPPEFSTEDEGNLGYRSVPVHVGPCMMAGAAVAYYVLHHTRPVNSYTATWAKGPVVNAMREYGKWDGLEFDTIEESNPPNCTHTCPYCGRGVVDNIQLIPFIKHLREDKGEWGLAEAKTEAERLFKEWGSLPGPLAHMEMTNVTLNVTPANNVLELLIAMPYEQRQALLAADEVIMEHPEDWQNDAVRDASDRLTAWRDYTNPGNDELDELERENG